MPRNPAKFRQADVRRAWAAARKTARTWFGQRSGQMAVSCSSIRRTSHGRRPKRHWRPGRRNAMRIRLKGLNSVSKILAGGGVVTYYYAWKGGPRLTGEPGTPEFIASYHEAVSAKKSAPPGALLALLQAYQASSEFGGLRERTRSDYVKQIKQIEIAFGDMPVNALNARGVRAEFMAWRDQLGTRSRRQADYAWTVLARVLSWSKDRKLITENPCERGGRLYRGNRADKIWTADDEAAFYRTAPSHLHLPVLLALWTGQREGDLLRLTWSAYDGETIRLKQSKTGARVSIPVGARLRRP